MKRENLKTIIIASLIIIFALSATYAYFELSVSNNSISGSGGCFEVNYSGTEINSANLKSGTTYESGEYSTVTLSKDADCDMYNTANIYLHTNEESTAPLGQAFKYLVLNGQTIVAEGSITSQDNLLATVTLTTTATDYTVYLWIDSSISEGSYNNKTYSGYIYATSINDSDIKDEEVLVNVPNLDNNNLIPVYYDNTNEVWKKADSTNANNNWYDYDNKKWANAVLIKDNTKRATYQSATKDTPITDSDISGFLVWIPRYKYRVWNITRQAGTEDTYAYPAYTNGIDIEFESGTTSTGNVECDYNIANSTPSTTLSDVCTVNGTTITPESGNTNFTDAWYTHPAFTFNNSNKTGFWIGKFETTGTADVPTVLPDTISLTNQDVSTQFTTSRVFQTYGLSSSVNAHMLTNLEWGAMAYLTHSIYGLCNGTSCRDAYMNNSAGEFPESGYTGRSAGVLSSSSSSSTYGTYNYKGYSIDSSTGSPTGTKTENLVASTTGNITGVYDISGGVYEIVMANQVDSSNNFNPGYAGDSWDGFTTPNTFYYNTYSYGETDNDQIAFNRSYLGDATAETTGGAGSYYETWQPGTGLTSSRSNFVEASYGLWFLRSGSNGNNLSIFSGSFGFNTNSGGANLYNSFRLSIS